MQQIVPQWTPRPRELAPWASDPVASSGRVVDEAPCPMRTPFQRDRDRIVHATAFRRLNYKTQVFLFHEGDHYRSRLTHSLEVAQVARAISRQLGLDEDLAEAVALAHDLGHPPFGHAGERALDRAMASHGGFDHNAQSLRVVTRLERKYWKFDGLNLTVETLEGLAKHNGAIDAARQPLVLRALAEAGLAGRFRTGSEAGGEAQTAAIADDIAYASHDVDDALRAGVVSLDDLKSVPLVGPFATEAARRAVDGDRRRAIYEINRRMITVMVEDVLSASRVRLAALHPERADDIRRAEGAVITFSKAMAADLADLKAFLFANVYRHERVMRAMRGAEVIIADLFQRYVELPRSLPGDRADGLSAVDPVTLAFGVCDFIAGMTDRFAIAEHRRLFDATPDLS